ncbi:MAG: UvrD-helicase domain-containing protein, partial [Proteobacteria bacterium]|nr:UvrD-helicase domain-containing protein [Pseudomonadota bacterium]
MRSLEGLNPQQYAAVEACDNHLLVVAGAGSGKTRVLTHKIIHLIEDRNVYPSQILAMTFSNKAANEMKNRIRILLPSFEQPHWIGTFHSICLRILKEFHTYMGINQQFSIYDDDDQLTLLKQIMEEMNIDTKQVPPKAIRWQIAQAKNESEKVVEYLQQHNLLSPQGMEVAKKYQEKLLQNQAMDFGDLLIHTLTLLRKHPEVKAKVHHRWRRILIDEYQDTNNIQKDLIKELAGPNTIICAVGDEDQAIYSWRGARVENMSEFEQDFPDGQVIKLDQNYRSTKQILAVANSVIKNNYGRREKKLWTENPEGEQVQFYLADDDMTEAMFVIGRIQRLRDEGFTYKDCCILYRTHVQSRLLEEEARKRNIPYQILGGTRFYDRMEIKDTLSFLKLAANSADNVAFDRIINKPARGIGAQTLAKLAGTADQLKMSWFDAIPRFNASGKSAVELGKFYLWMKKIQTEIETLKPTEVAERILKDSGYMDSLEKEGTVEAESRIENINELLRSIEDYEEMTKGSILGFLDQVALISDLDKLDPETPMLTMMTVHNSKGLEYPNIFVVGMEEGVFPHQRSLDDSNPNEVEEERRLCYVAMTRAEKKLHLTACQQRRHFRNVMFNPVSRFIGEIPESMLNVIPN